MAIVAAGIVIGYDWQSDLRFKVRLDIYSHTTENSASGVLTTDTFSVEDPEGLVNAGIHTFLTGYIVTEWGMTYEPGTDEIVVINPYQKAPVSATLSSKCIAFWKLDEDTGTSRADSVGENHLTEVGTVPRAVGKVVGVPPGPEVGWAASFQGDGGHLVIADSPDLVSGNFDFTFAFWAKVMGGGTAPLFSSQDSILDSEVFGLWWNSVGGIIELHVHNGVALEVFPTSFVPPLYAWTFFRVWYNTADESNLWTVRMVGGGSDESFFTTAHAAPLDTSNKFALGGCDADAGAYLYGDIDAFGYYRPLLVDADETLLLNNGAGQEPPFAEVVPPATPFGTGFVHVTAGAQDTNAQATITFAEMDTPDPFTVLGNPVEELGPMTSITVSQALDLAGVAEDPELLGTAADGDMLVRIDGVWTVIHKGTAGQVWTMNAGGTAPEWQ